MILIELNSEKLESILCREGCGPDEMKSIKNDISQYDRYFFVKDKDAVGFIKIWRQHFKDPYMMPEFEECELVTFKGSQVYFTTYIDALDRIYQLPQVIRCPIAELDLFKSRGFQEFIDKPRNYSGKCPPYSSSLLLGMIITVDQPPATPLNPNIRNMTPYDLPAIQKMFELEYSARFRAVDMLFHYSPESCFVYDDGLIKGVAFGELQKNYLYIHQIAVEKTSRGKNVDLALVTHIYSHAYNTKKEFIKGTIRGNLLSYYLNLGMKEDISIFKSKYLFRNLSENS